MNLDLHYLKEWAKKINVNDLLDKALKTLNTELDLE